MLAMMYLLLGWARQARDSASNGASTGDISPILVRPCLVKDNTALGTVSAPGRLPTFAQALLTTVPGTHSLGGSSRSLWNKRRALEPHHKEGAHQVSRPVAYSCCVRARWHGCCMNAACCATVQPCAHIFISTFKFSTKFSTRAWIGDCCFLQAAWCMLRCCDAASHGRI
jgi:hypothetical protein